jgi:uncharacterized membrane protein YdbT with pleckstrin-like domain
MSYAESVLQPGERIVAAGRLHAIIYWPAIAFLVAGIVLVWWEYLHWPDHPVLISSTAITFAVLCLIAFARAWFIRWITEFAVTDRRVIFKRGFIWRETAEMNMDKVETVDVDQSVLGRILDYGTIRITGTGGTKEIYVRRIAAPFALRNAIVAK